MYTEVAMKNKILISIVMTLILVVTQVSVAFAQESITISGAVQEVTLDTSTGETTVLVTLVADDIAGTTQTVRLSVETAEELGLVTKDQTTGEVTLNEIPSDLIVNIDPSTIIVDEGEGEGAQHPVSSALSDFFNDLLGVDYETIMGYHDDGAGFGVIAQALWMTNRLEGDTETFQMILDAKLNNDYSAINLPDGSTPQNWGQFKKAVMGTGKKENLGTVMSGHAEDTTGSTTQENSNGNAHQNKDKKKDKSDKGNGHNK